MAIYKSLFSKYLNVFLANESAVAFFSAEQKFAIVELLYLIFIKHPLL